MTLLTEKRQDFVHTIFNQYCKGQIVFDLGATEGDYTQIALDNGAIKVYAFEPGAVSCAQMRTTFANDNRVIIEQCAVSDEITILKNVTWLNSWCLGRPSEIDLPVSPGACDIEGYDLVDIATITLDDYMNKNNVNKVGIFKLDIDGYEHKALRGATRLLDEDRPLILMELSFYVDKIEKNSVPLFIELLKNKNYQFVTHDGYLCSPELVLQEYPWHSSCDVILIPNEQLDEFKSLFNNGQLT